MRKLLIIAFSILYFKNVSGQVILYDLPNFQGVSRSFPRQATFRLVGEAGLNDKITSIKVPPGMGVIIYADANENGGAGDYVDLLEDCADLSVYAAPIC